MMIADLQAIRELDRYRFVLPKRPLGRTRVGGLFLLIFGAVITVFMIFWMSGPLGGFFRDEGGHLRWALLVFGLFGLPGLLAGLAFMGGGLAILLNVTHAEVELTRDSLRSVECWGALRIGRSRALDAVTRLSYGRPLRMDTNSGKPYEPFGPNASVLRAEGPGMKPLWIAPGYPPATLQQLADALAESREELGLGSFEQPDVSLEVVEETRNAGDEPEILRPAGTKIALQDLPNGFTVTVPPAGIWRGSKGFFPFSLFWNGFMVVFTSLFLRSGGDADAPLFAWFMILLFWGIGLAMLAASINMGRRKVLLAVVADTFAFRVVGPFTNRERKVSVRNIAGIRVGPSGVEINDEPVLELQVRLRDSEKIGLLGHRPDPELEWIAYELRTRLGKPARGS